MVAMRHVHRATSRASSLVYIIAWTSMLPAHRTARALNEAQPAPLLPSSEAFWRARCRPIFNISSSKRFTAQAIQQQAQHLGTAMANVWSGNSRLLFHHLKKAGGTAICEQAAANHHSIWSCKGNRTVTDDPEAVIHCNCNGGYNFWDGPFTARDAAGQQAVLRQHPDATIFFNEGPMADEPYYAPELFQFTIVRHPLPRFLSHMLHAMMHPPELFQDVLKDPNPILQEVLRTRQAPARYAARSLLGGDNFITRMYAGLSVERHKGRLFSVDLQKAVRNLDQLDVVLVYEDMHGSGRQLLGDILQLPVTAARSGRSTQLSQTWHERVIALLSPETMSMVLEHVQYDLLLYEHCRALHNVSVAAWELVRSGGAASAGGAGVR